MSTNTAPQSTTETSNEFEIAEQVTALMDPLRPEKRDQVMALLRKRYPSPQPQQFAFKKYPRKRFDADRR